MLSRAPKALCALLVSLVFCGVLYAQDYNHNHHDNRYSSRHTADSHVNRAQSRVAHEQADRIRHDREQAYRRQPGAYNNPYYNGRYTGAYSGPYNNVPYNSGAYGNYGGYGGYPAGYGNYGGYPGGGYGSYGGYPAGGGYGGYAQNNDTQRAYQAGYNNGVNDRSRNKGLNLKTGNWHGINLQAYQQGYEAGYRSEGGGRRW